MVFLVLPIGWIYQLYYRLRYKTWPTYIDRSSAAELARDNARRNPQRTASTAAALMIGLALVTMVAMLASGILASFTRRREQDLDERRLRDHRAEQLRPDPDRGGGRHREGARASRRSATCAPATRERSTNFFATAVNPAGGTMFKLDWKQGSQAVFSQLGANGAFVDDGYAKRHHLTVGSPIVMTFSSGAQKTFVHQGHLQPADRRLAVRHGDDLADRLGQAQREPEEPLLVRAHARRRVARERSDPQHGAQVVPEREGADAPEVHRQPDRGAQEHPERLLRAARAVGDREPLRHRQHARPDGVRADA